MDDLPFLGQLGFVALGVIASIMIPVLLKAVPGAGLLPGETFWSRLWKVAKPYVALGIVSLLIGLVILAIFEQQDEPLNVWWEALLAGYVADSTLQKFREAKK